MPYLLDHLRLSHLFNPFFWTMGLVGCGGEWDEMRTMSSRGGIDAPLNQKGVPISLSISHPLSNSGVTLRHDPSRGHDRAGDQCVKRLLLASTVRPFDPFIPLWCSTMAIFY